MHMVSSLRKRFFPTYKKRFPDHLQLRFLKQLFRLLTNGYTLIQALEIIQWDKQLAHTATNITSYLKQGLPIDQAFANVGFHPTITAYLYFVRTHGDLEQSISNCLTMFKNRLESTKKFQQMIRYPIILMVIFSFLLIVIKQSVLPSFMELYAAHPEASSMIFLSVQVINICITIFMCLIGLTVLFFVIWQVYKKYVPIHQQIKFYHSIPIYRTFISLQTSYHFAVHLSSLLKTGMPIKDILKTMSQQKKLPIIAYYASLMTSQLTQGYYVSSLLEQLPLIKKQLAYIFQKNTDMNALEKDLSIYTELVLEDTHNRIMKLITLIQPIFFLFIASFIVFIYLTLMWPMFQLIKTI